ncbi:hypothetical protein Tco_0857172 [Tanacetum coccineum]|uniref:Uncharacterized protein n=1 Tax=Tanacetum coccineum TaxID=301880 RepID=A0ABQ5B5L1_9ASTR
MYCRLVHRMTLEGLVFMPDCLTKVGQIHERQWKMLELFLLVHHGHLFQTPGVQKPVVVVSSCSRALSFHWSMVEAGYFPDLFLWTPKSVPGEVLDLIAPSRVLDSLEILSILYWIATSCFLHFICYIDQRYARNGERALQHIDMFGLSSGGVVFIALVLGFSVRGRLVGALKDGSTMAVTGVSIREVAHQLDTASSVVDHQEFTELGSHECLQFPGLLEPGANITLSYYRLFHQDCIGIERNHIQQFPLYVYFHHHGCGYLVMDKSSLSSSSSVVSSYPHLELSHPSSVHHHLLIRYPPQSHNQGHGNPCVLKRVPFICTRNHWMRAVSFFTALLGIILVAVLSK